LPPPTDTTDDLKHQQPETMQIPVEQPTSNTIEKINEESQPVDEFSCPEPGCGKSFKTELQLRGHIGGAHGKKKKNKKK